MYHIKPYQCRNSDYWTDDTLRGLIIHQQKYRHSDNNNNVYYKFVRTTYFWNNLHQYDHSQKIGRVNELKSLGASPPKGLRQDS